MFEVHALHFIRRYLGEYVHGLSTEALRISVWKGDVVLKDLKLKAEALNSLKLPVTVKAGFVGTITARVPWKSFGKELVIVLIDRVFVLAYPAPNGSTLKEDSEKLFESKLQQIEDAESAMPEAKAKSKPGSPPAGNSCLGSLFTTIIGNLKITISNVHIRYEDSVRLVHMCFSGHYNSVSNAGNPFSVGFTLAKLAAVTMDEQGNETFDTSGASDELRKSLQLERLAVYHDSNSLPWKINRKWGDLSPKEWVEIFEDGINESSTSSGGVLPWALNHSYLVSPINGDLKYHRLGNRERSDPEIPFESASLVLSDVSLTVTEAQHHDWIKLLEAISRYRTYVEVSHLRPTVPVYGSAKLWWRYAFQAVLQRRGVCLRFKWIQIQHLCQQRRRYVHLYACSLQQLSDVYNSELRKIEKDLDSKVIILWRLLAHAKMELVKYKEASERKKKKGGSWFSFNWHGTAEDSYVADVSQELKLMEERLTKEEWLSINKLLSYQPDEVLNLHSGNKMQNMTRLLVVVSIGQAAVRIIIEDQAEIVCGRFEHLHVSTKFKHRSAHCDVLLRFYGLSASLAQSAYSEQKVNALAASFVRFPVGGNVDWRLSATISPCHATVLMDSYYRFKEFMKRSSAVSPTVAIETATALQMKFEKVTRRAQKQFQMALEEQSRFSLDIDFDAPKVRVPIRMCASSKCESNFLLDFGHFTLYTKESQYDEQKQSLYSRFYIYGRDIAALFTGCSSNCQNCTLITECSDELPFSSPLVGNAAGFYSIIDKCGMAVVVDQIKIPHPSYPSTRVSVQVPILGIHFSPARYCGIVELLHRLYGKVESSPQTSLDSPQGDLVPWGPVDLASGAKILVWRGIGNSVAAWHPCFLVLSGFYLYVLESAKSQSHQQCCSMGGKQVYEVPPANIGGSQFCIAVGIQGTDIQKVLESSSTLVIKFEVEEENVVWLKGLVHATYRASPPSSVNVHEESSPGVSVLGEPRVTISKNADLVINGALAEAKFCIYGKAVDSVHEKCEETLILDILAGGAKVHVCLESDLTIKMKLHSLKIKDELLSSSYADPQYLACSVLNNACTGPFTL